MALVDNPLLNTDSTTADEIGSPAPVSRTAIARRTMPIDVSRDTSRTPLHPPHPRTAGYVWTTLGIGSATGAFWLAHHYLDKGQASLLYLPVVIACAWWFGFGPAVLGSVLSFLCWNFFFIPPYYTLRIENPTDWVSLFVFLLAALTAGRLASQARAQTDAARARETEIATLHHASVAISQELSAERLLPALTEQLLRHCSAARCVVLRLNREAILEVHRGAGRKDLTGDRTEEMALEIVSVGPADSPLNAEERRRILEGAEWARLQERTQGTGNGLLIQSSAPGVYVPLRVDRDLVGVLYLRPRSDGDAYTARERRLILTLANHAAVTIARQQLAEEAAQVAALREADHLKDSLLSLVSHELRTPLAAIKATATGLIEPGSEWDEAALHEGLIAINTEADRLAGVVGNLLDLSRLEAGAWKPLKDWCDVIEILGTALDRLPPDAASRVQITCPPELLFQADYTQIALVLTNLLENAAKYASGPIDLEITRASGLSARPDTVLIRVRDYGAGLQHGEEDRIFTRFTRGARHANSAIHGAGLGLALCQAIVTAHGGRIWASNAPADAPPGAVFSVELPQGAP